MSLPKFAYDNILTTGIVTTTSENASFPISNLTNWKPTRWWKAASVGTQTINIDTNDLVNVDYFGVFSHNLEESGASVKLQYSDDRLSWNDLTEITTKLNSEVIFKTFDSVLKKYFRVVIYSPTQICSIGILSIGKTMEMQRGIQKGFTPPHMNTKNKHLVNVADSGLPLGSSVVRRESELKASFENLSVDWIRSTWELLMQHAELNPLFFSWNDEFYEDEAVFTMLDTQKTITSYVNKDIMSLKVSGKAWHKL